MDNPYKPPMAQLLRCEPEKPGSLIKSVAAGIAIEFGGTLAISRLGFIIYAIYWASQGDSEEHTYIRLLSLSLYSGAGLLFPITRLVMSILAGYVCAKLAPNRKLLAVMIVSILSMLIGLNTITATHCAYCYYSPIEHLGLTALCFPALCFGVYLSARGRHPRKRKAQATWTMTD